MPTTIPAITLAGSFFFVLVVCLDGVGLFFGVEGCEEVDEEQMEFMESVQVSPDAQQVVPQEVSDEEQVSVDPPPLDVGV